MSSSGSTSLAPDEVFEILSSQRRRMVLYYLRQHEDPATVNELAEQIAAWENDVEIEELTSQQRKRVYVSLYQTHLPKLAETRIVDYDVDDGEVRLTDQAEDVDVFLSSESTRSYPWRRHYIALLLLGGTLLGLGLFATPVLGSSLVLWLAGGVVVGYLVTVAIEYRYYRKQEAEIPEELAPREK
jgi:DNA-binding transcriptional ArsR family regulator